MLFRANAKINLGLAVRDIRPDGYHNIETIFYPILSLYDDIEIVKTHKDKTLTLSVEGAGINCTPQENIVSKCYAYFAERYVAVEGVSIRLIKRIPSGAGLGGGSSDAAMTAIAINTLFNLNIPLSVLQDDVRHLGADCPFFLYNRPCLAQAIGDILQPIRFDLAGMQILIVKPPLSINTKEAYIHTKTNNKKNIWSAEQTEYKLSDLPTNDFEDYAFATYPQLADIKNRLLAYTPFYASMTGSGSALFGIYPHTTDLRGLINAFERNHYFIHKGML